MGSPSSLRLCGALLAAAILLCCTLSPAAALNYNNVCALVPTNTMIASNDACNIYYQCNNGVATQQTCATGFSFSVQQQQCLPQSQVNCFANQSNPCEGRQIGTWAPKLGSCQEFYYCSATGPQLGACPNNLNFDANKQMCDYITCQSTDSSDDSSESTTTVVVNLCDFIQPHLYFGSPSACAGWNICQNGAMTSGTCRSGFLFNTNIMECDYPSDVTCIQVTNDPELGGSPPVIGATCSQNGLTQAINNTCNAYYSCNGNNFVYTYCPAGLYYDTVSQTCVSRMNARNNCDRCQGTTSTFVNAYSNVSCTDYLYCKNGVEVLLGSCPNGAYYDESLGACAYQTEPQFGCCNPSVYSSSSNTTDAPDSSSTTVSGSTVTTVAGASTTFGGASTTVAGASTTVTGASTTVAGASNTVTGASTTVASASTTVAGASTTVASTTTATTV